MPTHAQNEQQKICHPCEKPVTSRVPACPLQCKTPHCKAYMTPTPPDTSKKPIVWIVGGPGSGKETQAHRIVKKYGFVYFRTGVMLLEESLNPHSKYSRCIANILSRGALVPSDIVTDVLKAAIARQVDDDTVKGFVIGGFPRQEKGGHIFEKNIGPVSLLIFLDAKPDTMLERTMKRTRDTGRPDKEMVKEEEIRSSIYTFFENNSKVLAQYPHKLVKIDAERTPDEIFNDVDEAMTNMFIERTEKAKRDVLKCTNKV